MNDLPSLNTFGRKAEGTRKKEQLRWRERKLNTQNTKCKHMISSFSTKLTPVLPDSGVLMAAGAVEHRCRRLALAVHMRCTVPCCGQDVVCLMVSRSVSIEARKHIGIRVIHNKDYAS